MNINIKYNEKPDEFTCDLNLTMRLERYVENHFYPAISISQIAPIYLVGGSIRDLIMARTHKDLDFVVLGLEYQDWILSVLKKFNINYELNRFGGFKFIYNGTKIDLWTAEDLFSSMQYNVDGLYYDIKGGHLLSLTFSDFMESGLRLINPKNNIEKGRERKLIKFQEEYFK